MDAFPIAGAFAFFVVLEIAGVGFATQAAQVFHPDDQIVGFGRRVGVAHSGFGGFHDADTEVDGRLIPQLDWTHWETKLLCRAVDQLWSDAFGDHARCFVAVRNDAAVGVEETRVVHNDWRLADLADVIQRFSHGAITGFGTFDDLDQQHFLDWREEVDADELFRTRRRFGQIGNR